MAEQGADAVIIQKPETVLLVHVIRMKHAKPVNVFGELLGRENIQIHRRGLRWYPAASLCRGNG